MNKHCISPQVHTCVPSDRLFVPCIRNVVLALTTEEREEVRKIYDSVPDMQHSQLDYSNQILHAFLLDDDSLTETNFVEEFIPFFPRKRRVGYGDTQGGPDVPLKHGIRDLASAVVDRVRIGSDDSDEHFSNATLELVDGWRKSDSL